MPRSLKKGPFVDAHVMKKVDSAVANSDRRVLKTCRAARPSCLKWWG